MKAVRVEKETLPLALAASFALRFYLNNLHRYHLNCVISSIIVIGVHIPNSSVRIVFDIIASVDFSLRLSREEQLPVTMIQLGG